MLAIRASLLCSLVLLSTACGDADGSAPGDDPGLGGANGLAGAAGTGADVPPDDQLGGAGGQAGAPAASGGQAGEPPAESGGAAGASEEPPTPPEPEPPASGAPSGCPSGAPPPGPFALRFDVATLQCGSAGACTGNEDKCFCQPDFAALAALPGHFMAVGSDMNKAVTWASGNVQAVYVDDFNTDWKLGGAARADALLEKTKKKFPCGVPKWFIMNEISHSLWQTLPEYRAFVVDFAKRMKSGHGKSVIIASPFPSVKANGATWSELQKWAFIGVENYLSGREIRDAGFSLAWCKAQYQASVAAYAQQGVPKSRLVLFEHFANSSTLNDNGVVVKWGRENVSAADWHKAIKVRSQAGQAIGFAGFVSYDWGANGMHAPEADRLAFMKTYTNQLLP